jgi:hypothetical protein
VRSLRWISTRKSTAASQPVKNPSRVVIPKTKTSSAGVTGEGVGWIAD